MSDVRRKRNVLYLLFAAEALLCAAGALLQAPVSGGVMAVMAFPFDLIGRGLRALSLSGGAGNVAAVALYVLCAAAPCVLAAVRKKRKWYPEDALLVLLSALLFVVLYAMVNPRIIAELVPDLSLGKALLGGTTYSVLCAYWMVRAMRLFFAGSIKKLQAYLQVLLCVINGWFVYLIFGTGVRGFLDSLAALRAAGVGSGRLGISEVFLALRFIADCLPYALNMAVVFAGLSLLRELAHDRHSDAAVAAAETLSRCCCVALGGTVMTNAAFNVLQLLFARQLGQVNGVVQIPVLSIAFVLAALLFSRLVAENKALKEDNDSII